MVAKARERQRSGMGFIAVQVNLFLPEGRKAKSALRCCFSQSSYKVRGLNVPDLPGGRTSIS